MPTTTIKVSGMHCASCAILIRRRLLKIPDVKAVEIEPDGSTSIEATREISKEEAANSLSDTDYKIL